MTSELTEQTEKCWCGHTRTEHDHFDPNLQCAHVTHLGVSGDYRCRCAGFDVGR